MSSPKPKKNNLAEIKNIRENMKKTKPSIRSSTLQIEPEEKTYKTRESVFDRMKKDQKKWREKKEPITRESVVKSPVSTKQQQKKPKPLVAPILENESSSSYSSNAFEDVSDGIAQIDIRPSYTKIVMKADKVKKKKKTTLDYCLNSFRKVDFIRKSNLIECNSSESDSE